MAAQGKEAAKAETKATEVPDFYAFEFKLAKDKIGEKTTNPQIKSKAGEAFLGYGAFTESQVLGGVGQDRTVIIFFARLFEKGLPTYESLKAGEKATIKIYDEDVELTISAAKPSGGGATTGTSGRPKKEAPKAAGRGRGRGRGDKPKDGEKKEGEAKDGEKPKDGGRGRGRGEKKDEKKESMARGRANIGGKLGPVSKVRLAKIAKEAREKENAERIARGEAPIEDKKKSADDDDEPKLPAKGGKKEAAKAGAKKEAGKAGAKAPAKGKGK